MCTEHSRQKKPIGSQSSDLELQQHVLGSLRDTVNAQESFPMMPVARSPSPVKSARRPALESHQRTGAWKPIKSFIKSIHRPWTTDVDIPPSLGKINTSIKLLYSFAGLSKVFRIPTVPVDIKIVTLRRLIVLLVNEGKNAGHVLLAEEIEGKMDLYIQVLGGTTSAMPEAAVLKMYHEGRRIPEHSKLVSTRTETPYLIARREGKALTAALNRSDILAIISCALGVGTLGTAVLQAVTARQNMHKTWIRSQICSEEAPVQSLLSWQLGIIKSVWHVMHPKVSHPNEPREEAPCSIYVRTA